MGGLLLLILLLLCCSGISAVVGLMARKIGWLDWRRGVILWTTFFAAVPTDFVLLNALCNATVYFVLVFMDLIVSLEPTVGLGDFILLGRMGDSS